MTSTQEPDDIQMFLLYAGNVLKDARFVQTSLPNVDKASVERCLRQLHAVHVFLEKLDDPWLSRNVILQLIGLLLEVASPLQVWLESSQEEQPSNVAQEPGRGRPRYIIDLDRAIELHDMEISWEQIAKAMGVSRCTLYYHLNAAGKSTSRKPFTIISDDDLNSIVQDISQKHPLSGSVVIRGHLESTGIHVPAIRVQESLRIVDSIGVDLRWYGAIRRRVYRVRGSNALWHHDGNEKLRPWGFYVHGCVDGHSRLVIYLKCSNNKRSQTVEYLFLVAIRIYGWPSRMRGDFGTENNGVEAQMIRHWGEAHHAYLRGRSIHNVRIERLWRDVWRDTLEFFRTIFIHLENIGLLDMESHIHRICLFLIYHHRIQCSLDETVASWNLHKIRTAGNRSPLALYQVSREEAIRRGYWTGDPGDNLEDAMQPDYGDDQGESFPPADELQADPTEPNHEDFPNSGAEKDAGIYVNGDDEIEAAHNCLDDMDFNEDDGNFGIDIYCTAVAKLSAFMMEE